MKFHEIFEKHEDEFLKFDRVSNKKTLRPDLHAFLLLDQLIPSKESGISGKGFDILCHAEHDEIWLDVDVEEWHRIATEEQIVELIRCGIRYDASADSLAMFV